MKLSGKFTCILYLVVLPGFFAPHCRIKPLLNLTYPLVPREEALMVPPLADNTPEEMLKPLPTLIPPRVDEDAVGREYAFAPVAIPLSLVLSDALIKPAAEVVASE